MKDINKDWGIGVDIEEINRFNSKEEDSRFLNKIYSVREQKYCLNKKNPAQHLAAGYCGKEAIVKAFGSVGIDVNYNDVEILHKENGAPFISLNRKFRPLWRAEVSLSHCKDKAIAFAFVNKNKGKVFK